MLWYWGRRGFPVRLTDDLVHHFVDRSDVKLTVSLSRQSEGFAARRGLNAAAFHVDTFRSAAAMPAAILKLPRQRRALADFADAHEVEVVIALMRHPFSPWVLSALRQPKRRVLLMVHDALPHLGEHLPFWYQHFRLDLRATDGIIVLSEAVAHTMARVYDYPVDRTFLMPLPAPDLERRQHGRQAPIGRPWRLLFFGRIHEYKGLELLAQAYALLCERFSVTLRVVGEGHVEALTKLAALPGVTIEQGWIPDSEIASVFSQADIVVLPYIEASQSGVLVIAFAAGVPTVATPVGGLKEQIESGVTGLLAETVTPEGLAKAIATLISDTQLYERCSAGAIATAANAYSTERAAEALLKASRTIRSLPPR
jgi:glycosyltransferase involved in cell wall biosynthesis